jgi:hypothetical protein
MNECICTKFQQDDLVFSRDSYLQVKTEGFLAQNPSLNLEAESKMSCDGWVGQGSLHVRRLTSLVANMEC